jgi:hypothetical protein
MAFDILDFLRLRVNVLLASLGPSIGTHEDRVAKVQAQVRSAWVLIPARVQGFVCDFICMYCYNIHVCMYIFDKNKRVQS